MSVWSGAMATDRPSSVVVPSASCSTRASSIGEGRWSTTSAGVPAAASYVAPRGKSTTVPSAA
ncbi:hypothetical protein [Cellulomonas soli]